MFLAADLISSTLNPLFVVLLLWERPPRSWAFWLRVAVALGLAVGLAKLGKALPLWPAHPLFPSGHTTFSAVCATALYRRRGARWGALGAGLTVLMMVSLVAGGWHEPIDTLGGLVLGVGIATVLTFPLPSSRTSP